MLTIRTRRPVLVASVLVLTAAALTPGTSASATSQGDARIVAPTGRIVAKASGPNYVVSMLPDGSDRQRIVKYRPTGVSTAGSTSPTTGRKSR